MSVTWSIDKRFSKIKLFLQKSTGFSFFQTAVLFFMCFMRDFPAINTTRETNVTRPMDHFQHKSLIKLCRNLTSDACTGTRNLTAERILVLGLSVCEVVFVETTECSGETIDFVCLLENDKFSIFVDPCSSRKTLSSAKVSLRHKCHTGSGPCTHFLSEFRFYLCESTRNQILYTMLCKHFQSLKSPFVIHHKL